MPLALANFDQLVLTQRASSNIKITCHIKHKSFVVNAGRGKQSIKWLATTAAHRYYQEHTSNGRLRLRERGGGGARELIQHSNVTSHSHLDPTTAISPPSPPASPKFYSMGQRDIDTPVMPATFLPLSTVRSVLEDGDHIFITCTETADITCNHGA